jgi:hypothetical protein
MNTNIVVSELIALTFLILAPGVFSIILSFFGTLYFISMLRENIVKKTYNGSWWKFFKSWFLKKKCNG